MERRRAAITNLSVTAPAGPTRSNRRVARAAPNCTETAPAATSASAGGRSSCGRRLTNRWYGAFRALYRVPGGRVPGDRGGGRALGLLNVQLAVTGDGEVGVPEANPRASRTVPFVSKATGVELVKAACRLALGGEDLGARAPTRASAAAVECQGRRLAVRALPGQRSRPRSGDALDRRGDGKRCRPFNRARQGRARRGAAAAALRLRVHLDPRARPPAGPRADRGDARRPRLSALRNRGDGGHARGGWNRGRAGAEAQRGAGRRTDGRRPHPPWPLRSRDQHAGGSQRALGRLRDPQGGARAAGPVHHDAFGRGRRRARDCDRTRRAGRSRSRNGSMQSSGSPSRLKRARFDRARAARPRWAARCRVLSRARSLRLRALAASLHHIHPSHPVSA